MSLFFKNILIMSSGLAVTFLIYSLLKKAAKTKKSRKSTLELPDFEPFEYVSELTMKDVVTFFKEPSRLDLLRNNKKLIACAVKQPKNNQFLIVVSLFDMDSGDFVEWASYRTDKFDECLTTSFGDKDMIVLK